MILTHTFLHNVHRDHLKELHQNVANDIIEKQRMKRFCYWFKYYVSVWHIKETIYETPLFIEHELVEDDNIDDEEFIDDVYESNDESTDDEN